ncbi:MAG: PIN domain-containing protein [Spirochaetales bacterium]|nr:PIN domain-containing protein [Spirochaetales bacterium]
MRTYIDSGILIKLYIRERNSAEAIRMMSQFEQLDFNTLHELEIRNTFRTLEGRLLITSFQRAASEHELEADLIKGRLKRTLPDWNLVFREAINLSQLHSSGTLARFLDLPHVAAAILAQADLFVTGDRRQHAVAQKAGLQTLLIE